MTTVPPSTFADLLRHARRNAGLTQEELAERAGISARAISNLERGINRAPHRDTLELLMCALDVPATDRAQWERARSRLATRVGAEGGSSGRHLPSPLTSFIGREHETDAVAQLLREPVVRLLTLTGVGGIGKTRLAIKVAEHLSADFAGGVYFVPLAPLTHPDTIPTSIARVLGVREGQAQTPLQGLSSYLRGRSLLLVLDNFEHLVAGATVVGTLLEECPGLKVLTTSRVPLRLRGEREYLLRPLSDEVSAILFIERARDAGRDFQADNGRAEEVVEICRRLDGLPLAIELAAARSKVLPPKSLLSRLEHPLDILTGGARDLPARQQTLRETIAWSYDLLEPEAQALFRSLSVFKSGWSLEAAEFVAERDVFETLATLIESSLVEQQGEFYGEPRFRILETIREFGLELLAQDGTEAVVRERHARYMADLVLSAPPFLMGPDQIYWLDRLDSEHANIQLALDWFLEHDVETGLRMLGPLAFFWWLRMPLTMPRQYCDRFLERADDTIDPATLAAALTGAAIITEFENNLGWDRAIALHEQALSIWFDLRDPPEGAYWSFVNLGRIAMREGNFHEAEARFHQTLDYARRYDQAIGQIMGLVLLGNLVAARGDLESAKQHFRTGLALARELQDAFTIAIHAGNLGSLLTVEGRYEEALPLLEECLLLNRKLKLPRPIAVSLENLADLHRRQGRLDEAAALYRESLSEARRVNDSDAVGWAHLGLGSVALSQGDLADAMPKLRTALESCRSAGNQRCIAHAVEGLASASIEAGDPAQAVRLHAWANVLRDRVGIPARSDMRPVLERDYALLQQALSAAEFDSAWEAGSKLTLDELIDELVP